MKMRQRRRTKRTRTPWGFLLYPYQKEVMEMLKADYSNLERRVIALWPYKAGKTYIAHTLGPSPTGRFVTEVPRLKVAPKEIKHD